MSAHLMNTYKRLPVAFVRGEGAWLWDESGKRYLDALAGIAVNGLGHAHPRLVAAIADQAAKVIHTSNIYRIIEQEQLGEKLAQLSGMDNAFFNCSGAEANETAIKLARLYGHQRGVELARSDALKRQVDRCVLGDAHVHQRSAGRSTDRVGDRSGRVVERFRPLGYGHPPNSSKQVRGAGIVGRDPCRRDHERLGRDGISQAGCGSVDRSDAN
jgi:hypothetical protein